MLVFADQVRTEDPRRKLAQLTRRLRELAALPPGIERHAALVASLIEAGELAQGLADAAFQRHGAETRTLAERAAMALLTRIARAVRLSWDSGFTTLPAIPTDGLEDTPLPEAITAKRAEGFAFYALYPETYREAARPAAAATQVTHVTGIRSIGAPLAAVVADALHAPPPTTLRPVATTDSRKVIASPDFTHELLATDAACHALVDEGPGWSGSSFGAAADFLEDHGVPAARLSFYPSHAGDLAARAAPRHRRRWRSAARHTANLADLVIHHPGRPEHRLAAWVTDLTGPPDSPLQDLSAGVWRALRYPDEHHWPPSLGNNERRKHLLHAGGRPWLLKFAGLGRTGHAALARAHILDQAGFTPETLGLRHGFLVQRWRDDTTPLDLARTDRDRLATHLGRYLACRARHFPAQADSGATLSRLDEMARFNLAEAGLDHALDRWRPQLPDLEQHVRRVATDNRLHAWEWLVTPTGDLLKADAVDHCANWDLIGCQDIAWDIAGATIELALDPAQRHRVIRIVGQESGHPVDPDLLAFLTPCYLAFQLGTFTLAAELAADDPLEAARLRREAARLRREAARYATHLRHGMAAS